MDTLRDGLGDWVNSDGTPGRAFSALTDYVATIKQYPMYVGQTGADEWNPGLPNAQMATLMAVMLGRNPAQPHVLFGMDCFANNCPDWMSQKNPPYEDFFSTEGSGSNGTTDSELHGLEKNDYARNTYIIPNLGNLPNTSVTGSTGPMYCKAHTGEPYAYDAALGDGLVALGGSPVTTVLDLMQPVAHGYAGERSYAYDGQFLNGGYHGRDDNTFVYTPAQCTTALGTGGPGCGGGTPCVQEGVSPVSMYSTDGRGQDRWYSVAIANNLIKTYEAYILQPMATTQPGHAPGAQACDDGTATTFNGNYYDPAAYSSPGDPIVCGAHQGNGGFLVVIENYSDSANTYVYNPAPYYISGGTAVMWKINGSNNRGCGNMTSTGTPTSPNNTNGISSYSINGGLTGGYDCGIGDTWINGSDAWQPGQAFPAGVAAPTTTTTLNMLPDEVDVFLYHQ